MSDPADYDTLINRALAPLGQQKANRIGPMVLRLFDMIFPDLLKVKAVEGNPIEHHLIVLGHMMEIATGEKSLHITMKQAAALALLHDIAPVEKITTQMVAEARKRAPAEVEALEFRRQQNRILHMREGSAMAHRRMLELNERLRKIVFSAEAINTVCEVIRIHDNPSLDIPIPRSNLLAVAFREADRLWMITHEGIVTDLKRKDKSPDDLGAYSKQLASNIRRFREERALYHGKETIEGPFKDDETFFRTDTGYCIYCCCVKRARTVLAKATGDVRRLSDFFGQPGSPTRRST
jgi:hypothetical protein